MTIFNRRNALLGWMSWLVAKRVLRQKAREAVPGTVEGSWRPNKGAIAAAAAGVLAAVWFWRRTSGGDEAEPDVWTPGADG